MRPEIVSRLLKADACRHGLDAVVTSSPENFAYLNGFVVPSQPLIRHRHAMSIVTADGKTALFAVDMEATTVRGRAPEMPLQIWAEFTDSAMAKLAAQLTGLGLAGATIGIEMDYLPAGDFAALSTLLPKARWKPAEALARTPAADQDPGRNRAAAPALAHRRPGDHRLATPPCTAGSSEMDIAAALTRGVYALGAEHFKLMIVATGERSQLPNVGPSERKLQARDVCRVEIFSVISGYQAGVCRTAVVGEAPAHAERIWAHLVECKYMIMDMIKPGASAHAVYDAFIAKLAEMNLPPISFVGHGIGLHLHEDPYIGTNPYIGRDDDAILEAGMVLGIEPLCYATGHGFGMQNKDMFVVTETGCELLSDYSNTDRLLVVRG